MAPCLRYNPVVIALAGLAALGLILSIVVHASALLGYDPIAICPPLWALHIGIFVVFLPAVIANRRAGPEAAPAKKGRLEMSRAPRWLQLLTRALFLYALVNFGLFLARTVDGSPEARGGKYVLQNHGRFVRALSEAEFHVYQGYVARGFSGHWMAFYCASLTILVSTSRRDRRAFRRSHWIRPG